MVNLGKLAKKAKDIADKQGDKIAKAVDKTTDVVDKKTKGKYHCNYELSFERAHAVVHYLVEKGHVDSHRFVCEAYADNQPQSPNDKSKNRRVEIVIGKN